MPVGHLGPDRIVTADRGDNLTNIAETLQTENVGSVVVAENDEPIGVVTDRDIALALTESEDIGSLAAEDIMSTDPVTLHEGEEGMEISRTIEAHNVRRIPIVDENGKLSGIVTLDDLVATIGEQLENVANTIEVQSPDYEP